METMEIICISSDEETSLQKENKKYKLGNVSLTCEKVETLSNNDEKVEGNNLKRKMKTNTEEETQSTVEKKKKKLTGLNTAMTLVEHVFQPDLYQISEKSDHIEQPNKEQEVIIEKPKLIVKEKKRISYIAHDVFPSFISLCLQKSKDNDRKDMETIINKLKRRYEELDLDYTSSEYFVSFLNDKRAAIINDDNKIYVYIQEVMNEMKTRIRKKPRILPSNESYDAVPSTSYGLNKSSIDAAEPDYENDREENINPSTRKKIKSVLKTMEKCREKIKQLEEDEVDLDQDDSSYIKVERYKQRMVELYNKYCELTGENADAGRVYLRPKHISATRIVAIDQAITNFINSKISRRNKIKRTGSLTDDVIFPDYRDILECVNRCNEKKNLGLDETKQKQLAEKAFKELGELLQRTRRNDYWDTFSLYLENTREDPAIKDKDLAKKLTDNRTEGEKRLAAIFDEYYQKEKKMKEQNNTEPISEEEEEEEEEEESVDENKSKDDLSTTGLSEDDSNNEEVIKKKVKDIRPSVENGISNISTTNIYRNTNQVISNKSILDTSQQKYNENNKLKTSVKEINRLEPKMKNQIISEKTVHQVCSSNIVAENIVNSKIPKVLLSTCSTAVCANNVNRTEEDLPEMITEDMSEVITDPVIETITEDAADVIPKVVAEPLIEDVTEVITEDVAEVVTEDVTEVITEDVAEVITEDVAEVVTEDVAEVITEDVAEVVTEDVTEVITEDVAEVITDAVIEDVTVTENQKEEEKKPLLRVRSFAKPPTTWEVDSRQKTVKITQENASKETNQLKEVVDLTNEIGPITNKTPPITKPCTIKLGDKVFPVVKSPRLLIPTNKNIISVQNITNNYLKVNTRTGQIIAPVRDISASTIIRLPAQTVTRQNQPQNSVTARNEVPFRGNETILRIIQQGKPILISKKSAGQSVSKQINVHLPKTKPK